MGNKHGRTAEFTNAIRASHYLHGEHPLILDDPIAIDLLSPELRDKCLDGDRKNEFGRNGNASVVIGRACYAEDKLEAAVCSGTNQYIILGAGGDSFALRSPDLVEKIRVFEKLINRERRNGSGETSDSAWS